MRFTGLCCGERGIRTPGTSQYAGFQDRCIRPLCHLSIGCLWLVVVKINKTSKLAEVFSFTTYSGERGIRTPGTSQYAGFQDRCIRPLCHLSKVLDAIDVVSLFATVCLSVLLICGCKGSVFYLSCKTFCDFFLEK